MNRGMMGDTDLEENDSAGDEENNTEDEDYSWIMGGPIICHLPLTIDCNASLDNIKGKKERKKERKKASKQSSSKRAAGRQASKQASNQSSRQACNKTLKNSQTTDNTLIQFQQNNDRITLSILIFVEAAAVI